MKLDKFWRTFFFYLFSKVILAASKVRHLPHLPPLRYGHEQICTSGFSRIVSHRGDTRYYLYTSGFSRIVSHRGGDTRYYLYTSGFSRIVSHRGDTRYFYIPRGFLGLHPTEEKPDTIYIPRGSLGFDPTAKRIGTTCISDRLNITCMIFSISIPFVQAFRY